MREQVELKPPAGQSQDQTGTGSSSSSSSSSSNPFRGGSGSAGDPFAAASRARAPPRAAAIEEQVLQGGQRERSIELVNEGLGGLIPRVTRLFQLGGSVFLGFLPFMAAFSLIFTLIFVVFGESFLHYGSVSGSPPEYLDPEKLLSESTVDPYVPFDR